MPNCIACGEVLVAAKGSKSLCKAHARRLDEIGRYAAALMRGVVLAGVVPNPKTSACVDCGAQAVDLDHRDYMRPFHVEPVCRPCNMKRGHAAWHAGYCEEGRASEIYARFADFGLPAQRKAA